MSTFITLCPLNSRTRFVLTDLSWVLRSEESDYKKGRLIITFEVSLGYL